MYAKIGEQELKGGTMMETKVGATLKKIRKDKNIPIQSICAGVMDPATYWRLENGKINSSFPTVLLLMERMNLSIEEFVEELFSAEESIYQSYERELIAYFKNKDVEKLKLFKQKLAPYFEKKIPVKLTHLYYLADLYIAKIKQTENAKASEQKIKKYLTQCDNWNLYELTLLSNVLFIYDLGTSFHFYKTAANKRSMTNQKEIISLSLNMMALCIEKQDKEKVDYLFFILQKMELDEEMTYDIIIRKWGMAIAQYFLLKDSEYLAEAKDTLDILLKLGMTDTYNHYSLQTNYSQKIIDSMNRKFLENY